VHQGIAEFEAKLAKQGKTCEVNEEFASKAITDTLTGSAFGTKIQKPFDASMTTKKGNFTLTSTGLKCRTKKTLTSDATK
jgi:hypothetical protein